MQKILQGAEWMPLLKTPDSTHARLVGGRFIIKRPTSCLLLRGQKQRSLQMPSHESWDRPGLTKNSLTLQPAFPRDNAIALPIPLEAPVTTATGASTFWVEWVLACSTVATWALTPADAITAKSNQR